MEWGGCGSPPGTCVEGHEARDAHLFFCAFPKYIEHNLQCADAPLQQLATERAKNDHHGQMGNSVPPAARKAARSATRWLVLNDQLSPTHSPW